MKLILILLPLLIVHEYHARKDKNKKQRFDNGDWEVADIKDYSYMVSMVYQNTLMCGATIISNQWAITAAHCVAGLPKDLILNGFFVLRGNTSFAAAILQAHHDHQIIFYRVHEDFMGDLRKFEDDIALLQVREPFDALYEGVIDLVSDKFTYWEDYHLTMLGWAGITESRVLSFTDARISNNKDCLDIYKYIDKAFSNKKFCIKTTYLEPCKQYSGGPVVYDGTLYGIQSFSQECASDHFPAVYTKLTYYKDWISNNLNTRISPSRDQDSSSSESDSSSSESDSSSNSDSGSGPEPDYYLSQEIPPVITEKKV